MLYNVGGGDPIITFSNLIVSLVQVELNLYDEFGIVPIGASCDFLQMLRGVPVGKIALAFRWLDERKIKSSDFETTSNRGINIFEEM